MGKLQSILITNEHAGYDFIINRLYIFFWNDAFIRYGLLSDGIEIEGKKADFSLDALDSSSYIIEVRTGSNPEMFIFIIQQSIDVNSIYTWDTDQNAEAEAYDVEGQWEILWDKIGNAYIVDGDRVILNSQRLGVKTFDFEPLEINP